ncbi:hypothetical protein OAC46_00590 [Flavobacteriaceae bacterium]|nr:hypothetical protein [Flavobacteriaceae bacterium]
MRSYISKELKKIDYKYNFSVCTLVTNHSEYHEMIKSFEKSGFNENNTNFYFIDNSINNKSDAYDGLNKFLSISNSRYTIICHQDVRLNYDNKMNLELKIDEINLIDPNWAILGNAGGDSNFSKLHIRITDPHGADKNTSNFPFKVDSLDENFLLIKNGLNIGVSNDLKGFHFYGTDICIQAKIRGYSSYVIDFHLKHLSKGKLDLNFEKCKNQLIKKYELAFKYRFIQSSCSLLFISASSKLNLIFNNKIILKLKEHIDKIHNNTR